MLAKREGQMENGQLDTAHDSMSFRGFAPKYMDVICISATIGVRLISQVKGIS